MCGETGDSDTGSGVEKERGETVGGDVEEPASAGIPKFDACLIDSSIALAKSSSSSLEAFLDCSFDSFSERASAIAIASSSSSTGACFTSVWGLGGEAAGPRGGDENCGGGGAYEGGGAVSNGEAYRGDELDRYGWFDGGIGIDDGGGTGEM
jgi:hypothetical protein